MSLTSQPDPNNLPLVEYSRFESAEKVPYRRDQNSRTYTGSFGAVYKAVDSKGKAYAVKEIHAEDDAQQQLVASSRTEQILSEIGLLRKCQHPNVLRLVDVYCVETVAQTYFIVTEPWAPVTLQKFLGSISEDGYRSTICPWWQVDKIGELVLQLFHGLIEGLAYLHRKSIFHKDLKPENILLSTSTDPKSAVPVLPIIADLGISKVYQSGASTKFTDATVQYLAPEQIHHLGSGLKADVFAMGCCLLLLFAAAHSGGAGVRRIEELVINPPGSCQYGREIDRTLPALKEMLETGRRGLYPLGSVIQNMIHKDPNCRPDAESLRFPINANELLNIVPGSQAVSTSKMAEVTKNQVAPLGTSRQNLTTPLDISGLKFGNYSPEVGKPSHKEGVGHSSRVKRRPDRPNLEEFATLFACPLCKGNIMFGYERGCRDWKSRSIDTVLRVSLASYRSHLRHILT